MTSWNCVLLIKLKYPKSVIFFYFNQIFIDATMEDKSNDNNVVVNRQIGKIDKFFVVHTISR